MNNAKKQRKIKNEENKKSLQENWTHQGNTSYKDGKDKAQKE